MHPAQARFFLIVVGAHSVVAASAGRARSSASRRVVGSRRGAASAGVIAHRACFADLDFLLRFGRAMEGAGGGVEGEVFNWLWEVRASSEPEMDDLEEMGEFAEGVQRQCLDWAGRGSSFVWR